MTNPGGNTPWAGIPVPATSKSPDVPVDLAAALDKVDTVMKYVVGGTVAPTASLNPTVTQIAASQASLLTSVNSLDSRLDVVEPSLTTLGSRVTAVETKANFLYNQPVAYTVYRPWQYTMWSSQTVDGEVVNNTLLGPSYDAVMHVWLNATWKWSSSTVTWPIKTKVKIQVGSNPTFFDRIRSVQSGWVQTHQGHYAAKIPANTDVTILVTVATYAGGPANVNAELYESRAGAFVTFEPWNGASIPVFPIGTPPAG